ncbi:MAG: hypothetical protein K8S23_12490 [Candidatus Cloacimonetes bacterium]|nr:hypothetical protein [Candidatus Cloacimonadota bacterium]
MIDYKEFQNNIKDSDGVKKLEAMLKFATETIQESSETAFKINQEAKNIAVQIGDKFSEAKAIMGIAHYYFLKEKY